MKNIKLDDIIWHPCNMDIIEHKVVGIHKYITERKGKSVEGMQYTTKSKHNVGACGRVEVIISENNGKLIFIELIDEDFIEHSSGLQDFVEGNYYTTKEEAELEFYNHQEILSWSSMDKNKRLYDESKKHYEKVKLLVKELKNKTKLKQ